MWQLKLNAQSIAVLLMMTVWLDMELLLCLELGWKEGPKYYLILWFLQVDWYQLDKFGEETLLDSWKNWVRKRSWKIIQRVTNREQVNLLQNFNNGLINSKKEISKMGNKQLKNMLIRNTSGIFEIKTLWLFQQWRRITI